eukprot:UN25427
MEVLQWEYFDNGLKIKSTQKRTKTEIEYDGPEGPYNFQDGLETLTESILDYITSPHRINPVLFQKNFEIDKNSINIPQSTDNKRVSFTTQTGSKSFEYDGLISAIPAPELGKLCVNTQLDISLSQINRTAQTWVVTFNIPENDITKN